MVDGEGGRGRPGEALDGAGVDEAVWTGVVTEKKLVVRTTLGAKVERKAVRRSFMLAFGLEKPEIGCRLACRLWL